jgi:predicted alpha-1,6-mannanase (GH76 family)
MLGGLVELNLAASDPTYLPLANHIAQAALTRLSDPNGIIHDECEGPMSCGGDGTQFKGIFIRNLVRLHQAAPNPLYIDAIQKNAESIWMKDRQGECREYGEGGVLLDVNWAGPFLGQANASTQSSAMDGLVAAVQLGKGMELASGFIGSRILYN